MRSLPSWAPFVALVVLFGGVWGAFSALPTERYGYPEGLVYAIWSGTMILPAAVVLRRQGFDRRPLASAYGAVLGLAGATGQFLLFITLTMAPAYLVFPIVSVSPAVTVLLATALLRERLRPLALVGLAAVLSAVVLLSIPSDASGSASGPWLPLAVLVTLVWGVQAFLVRRAAVEGVNDATTFTWMALGGLALAPVALVLAGGVHPGAPWQAPVLTFGTQLLNAVEALMIVMALSRGKASVVAPVASALPPALTVVLSLLVYRALPTVPSAIGILLALAGSALMVRGDAQRGDAVADGARRKPVGTEDG